MDVDHFVLHATYMNVFVVYAIKFIGFLGFEVLLTGFLSWADTGSL